VVKIGKKVGSSKLGVRSWELEVGSWELGVGSWELGVERQTHIKTILNHVYKKNGGH
jgi:hypothetical protein